MEVPLLAATCLKKRLIGYLKLLKGIIGLLKQVKKKWNAIGKSVCQDLISSMPRRVEAVSEPKGGYT